MPTQVNSEKFLLFSQFIQVTLKIGPNLLCSCHKGISLNKINSGKFMRYFNFQPVFSSDLENRDKPVLLFVLSHRHILAPPSEFMIYIFRATSSPVTLQKSHEHPHQSALWFVYMIYLCKFHETLPDGSKSVVGMTEILIV